MSQQEAWNKQVQEIQGTIAHIEKVVLSRMEALEQMVRDQDALLQECYETIEAEYGNDVYLYRTLYPIVKKTLKGQWAKDLVSDQGYTTARQRIARRVRRERGQPKPSPLLDLLA